ncbi:MAG: response regulator [Chloroflexi bacterium]|nr:response regulator [Chloroflexota bacterium]
MKDLDVREEQDGLLEELRDALRHLYDNAYLADHPLAARLFPDLSSNGFSRSKALRMWLIDGIESLRPEAGTPQCADSWRIYHILQRRYIESNSTAEVMLRVNLGHSQYHVYHREALERLGQLLERRRESLAENRTLATFSGKNSLLREELRHLRTPQGWGDVQVGRVLDGVLAMFSPLATDKGVTLDRRQPDVPLPSIRTDPLILRQLLIQVVGNLLRTMCGGTLRIAESIAEEGEIVRLYAQGVLAPSGAILDIPTRELALALGAKVDQLVGDEGLAVSAIFPIERRKLALLIDNDRDLGQLFQRYLAQYDWNLVAVQDPDEGLRLAENLRPDVVILDVIMPQRDGWDVLSALRAHPGLGHMAIVVCSVLEQPELALSLGADMFLAKPVDQFTLLRALRRLEAAMNEG